MKAGHALEVGGPGREKARNTNNTSTCAWEGEDAEKRGEGKREGAVWEGEGRGY